MQSPMAAHVDAVYQFMYANAPPAQGLLLFFVPFVLLVAFRSRKGRKQSDKPLPPSPPGLPIIGHLHLVGANPNVSLRAVAAKHAHGGGGLMLLRLGAIRNLVVSSPRAAQAVMRTHDHVFASRPPSTAFNDLVYGSSNPAFAPYGEHWRQVKRLVTTHLLTVKKVQSFRLARREEVRLVVAKLRDAAAAAKEGDGAVGVDVGETMNAFTNDIACRVVSGKFFRAEGRNKLFRELIENGAVLFGGFNLEDYFPGLARSLRRVLSRFVRNKMSEEHERWDELLEEIISDHENKRRHVKEAEESADADFIDVMLSVQQEYSITRDHIKAILMDMFVAGTATTSLVLESAMVELMRNPHLMSKLQVEVRTKVPQGQDMVEEEDLGVGGMAYLRALVKETLRLHPPVPLLIPRQSMADCDVGGYAIPAGTRVVVNSWAISRDPESWEAAEEFVPERFVDGGSASGVDFRGNDFQFVPFGAGRRVCPGINFGMATIEIMLANLVYCFDWELPAGTGKEDIDMTEVFGLTVHRKEKLILVPKTYHISASSQSLQREAENRYVTE